MAPTHPDLFDSAGMSTSMARLIDAEDTGSGPAPVASCAQLVKTGAGAVRRRYQLTKRFTD